jgi:hypothetical protein
MKKIILLTLLFSASLNFAQSSIQTVNSGSIITASSSVSIGEIVINPVAQNQSSSGLIGILVQVNEQSLEVAEFEISETTIVYPNPTHSSISFKSTTDLTHEKVAIYGVNGQLLKEVKITSNNTIDLSELASGIYVIQFASNPKQSFKIIKH